MGSANKITLQKKLKGLRVNTIHLPLKTNKKTGEKIPKIKTIFGLAHPQDGHRSEHPPQVSGLGAGPKHVKFWLGAIPSTAAAVEPGPSKKPPKSALPSSTYISVYDYFKRSKS